MEIHCGVNGLDLLLTIARGRPIVADHAEGNCQSTQKADARAMLGEKLQQHCNETCEPQQRR